MSEADVVVIVGEKKYKVIKTGRAQAEQVLEIGRWLSKYGVSAVEELKKKNDGKLEFEGGIEFLSAIVDVLTADALLDLFQALVGCTKEEAEEYFDISILVDVVVAIFQTNNSIRRLLERFFSTPNSSPTTEESSTE